MQNIYENGNKAPELKPTYALEHLATFKVKNEAEVRNPKEKMKVLMELDKSGGIWPQKMYMCFSGQWLLMLDSDMKEIENFPGSMLTEPTAFISEDPLEVYNNILIFSISGASLGNTEMHIFQVLDVSAVHLVEDLRVLSSGNIITKDRNKSPIKLPKPSPRDQYGIAVAAAEAAAEKNAHDREQTERDVNVLNHCFEDIERFVARLQYAAEALRELENRPIEHNTRGEGLLLLRARPPTESEFHDILAKHKLGLNYSIKLQNHFTNVMEPVINMFTSLHTIVNVCNDVFANQKIPENVVNPLLKRETVVFLTGNLNPRDMEFWQSLGPNWTLPKDQFKDQKGSYHPIFYDEWSPDYVVDEEVQPLPSAMKSSPVSPNANRNSAWLLRLQTRNVKIAEALYTVNATNDKELSTIKGEYLEIIDDSRNWWKVRNSTGQIGYVPHTILKPHNFEVQTVQVLKESDTHSVNSSIIDNEIANNDDAQLRAQPTSNNRHVLPASIAYATVEKELREQQKQQSPKGQMPRSYSMPAVPVPPPMPPTESHPNSPGDTMKRNMATAGTMAAMRARNEYELDGEALMLQSTINDELKNTLVQREKRRDLEILKTPEIYIRQSSSPQEVENWLRGKGFSNEIVVKLRTLNGAELFALSPHVIESYFGQKESRRLISQIVLQKNISEYKTIRSTELSNKLAKVRQKIDLTNSGEVF